MTINDLLNMLDHPVLFYPALAWVIYRCAKYFEATLKVFQGKVTKRFFMQAWQMLKHINAKINESLKRPKEFYSPKRERFCHYMMAAIDYLYGGYFILYGALVGMQTMLSHQVLPFLNVAMLMGLVFALFIVGRLFIVQGDKERVEARNIK